MFDFIWNIINFANEVWRQLSNAQSPVDSALIVFFNGGWIPVVCLLLIMFKNQWFLWRWEVYHVKNRHFILLAIDVPRDNDQSPKAVEHIFAHLHGIMTGSGSNTIYENWWLGKTTDMFSMEIVSMEGYIQFLVYTQIEYRDMVESAFYAQYPDAEITEVEDYVYGQNGEFKHLTFPSDEYTLMGTEFVLSKPDAFPIRLYTEFEHTLSQEFKDPMAALLENMGKIGPGEQMWMQLVITPKADKIWQPALNAVAMKIAGKKMPVKENMVDKLVASLVEFIDMIGVNVFPFYDSTPESEQKKDDMPSLMLHLTPMERAQVEGIQNKANKVAYWTKFRFLHIAKKSAPVQGKVMAGVIGTIRQFNALNLNTFVAHKYTRTWAMHYLFVKQRLARRQNFLLRGYQGRSRARGSKGITLNAEELATIYHFPTETVKAPLVARTQAKRGSAPVELPMKAGEILREKNGKNTNHVQEQPRPIDLAPLIPAAPAAPIISATPAPKHPTAEAPENLPFV